MFNIKTAALSVGILLSASAALAESAVSPPNPPAANGLACPSGKDNVNHPGVPVQCTVCAAPGCPSCHNDRTQATVKATNDAVRDCPQPH